MAQGAGPVPEDQARAALAAFDGLGGLERWIAEQRPWQATPAGLYGAGRVAGLALPAGVQRTGALSSRE